MLPNVRPSTAGRAGSLVARLALVTLALGLSGCGLADEISLPTALPSASDAPTASASEPVETTTAPPSETAPETSAEPTEQPTASEPPAETPTEAPTSEPSDGDTNIALPPASDTPGEGESTTPPEPTSEAPTEEPTSEAPTSEAPTEEATSETASEETTQESESATATADEGDGGLPLWVPIITVAGLGIGAALLLASRSRRKKWDDDFAVEQTQARWVLSELLPAMTNPTTPPDALAAHWAGAQQTLDQLQAGLTDLLGDAPDSARAERVQGLSAAVADVRQTVSSDVALRSGTTPPAAGPPAATDQTIAGTSPEAPTVAAQPVPPTPGQPVDPAVLASSAARVAAARDRLAAALGPVA
jgi:hypothetical protein